MHLFYSPFIGAGNMELPEEEAHHAGAALRLRQGDRIGLVDGRGTRAEAEVTAIARRSCTVNVLATEKVGVERVARIHLAVAPTKQMERFEWMLEKCTEIGVDRITPLLTERTERSRLRRDRLERVLVSAMKQSQRTWLPQLDEPTSIKQLISGEISPQRCFGWCEEGHRPLASFRDPGKDILLLIGPEGDFTPQEAAMLRENTFTAVSLGAARLRTETAAVAACSFLNLAQQV